MRVLYIPCILSWPLKSGVRPQPKPTALLIIDVQQVLCSGSNAAFEVGRVIDRINLVSQKVRAAGALVVVIQFETEGSGDWITVARYASNSAYLRGLLLCTPMAYCQYNADGH